MNSQAEQSSFILTRRLADGTVEWIPLEIPQRVPADAEADYALIDRVSYEAPQALVARRDGDDLIVEVQGSEVLVLGGFFVTPEVGFYPTTDIAGGAGPFSGSPLTVDAPVLPESPAGQQIVWSAEPVEGEPVARIADEGDSSSGGSPLLWGGLAVGGLGLAAAAGGGGGGGGDDGGTPPPVSEPEPEPGIVQGSVIAGPVIEGNGLSVEVFQADGTSLLGEAKVAADGSFSIDVADYSGVVIAGVVDADSGDDFLDEASEASQDLDATLRAARDSGSGSTVFVNVNPLTTLAVALAEREAGGGELTPELVTRSNAAIAELFGVGDLHDTTVLPINGGNYDPSDGLSAGERYGSILAAFSGADMNNGGNSQQTIDDVLAGLTLNSDGTAVLSEAAQAILIQGAQTTESETGESLGDIGVDTTPPQITSGDTAAGIDENTGAGQVVYTATATDAGTVTWSLGADGDAAAFGIDADSGAVTLVRNPDYETQPSYSFTVVATDSSGNSSEQKVTLGIQNTDDSAPFITSGATAAAIDENSGADQLVYTAAATDSGPVTWSLAAEGDAADLSIDAATGAVTLADDPDHETKAAYTFTVVATDAEGNSSRQPVVLAVNDLDEVAPTITSGTTATTLQEDSGAGQVVYTVTSTDDGDISAGTTTYSLSPEGDAAAFTIDAQTGEVTLIDNPNFEAQSSYTFTVVATDAAGNSSDQAVSLAINDFDDVAPAITSGATADAIDENSGAGQLIYTATATDDGPVTWSLADGADAAALSIDADTGAVTLAADPDFEAKSSYTFTVVATDAVGNSSEQAVTLTINDTDEVAPTITSADAAEAIDENSGADQVVYTVTSTDDEDISTGATTYSLSPVDDGDAFEIDSATGDVTLIENPDFETQSSYVFTVVATDAAGNSSEQAVSLAVNDIADETPPTVSAVALTAADGAQNRLLNEGDTVQVTVTMSEITSVDTSAGTPRIALAIGGSTVYADYTSGSGTTSLVFEYTIQDGDSDDNGIAVQTNGLESNGGALTDPAGNAADLRHGPVTSDDAFVVDTTAPSLSSSSPEDDQEDVPIGADIVLDFDEDMQIGSGNIVISNGSDTRTIAATDTSLVSIDGSEVRINPGSDLTSDGDYSVTIDSGAFTDAAGNAYEGTTFEFETQDDFDTRSVVFDLVQGTSSDHSSRTFQSDESYDVYIRVDSDDATLSTAGTGPGTWGSWSGAESLGSDDKVILVGNGAAVQGPFFGVDDVSVDGSGVAWETAFGLDDAAVLQQDTFVRVEGGNGSSVALFDSALPESFLDGQGGQLASMYMTTMPGGILTSQGLV